MPTIRHRASHQLASLRRIAGWAQLIAETAVVLCLGFVAEAMTRRVGRGRHAAGFEPWL